ncbi:Pycsar system effector family protein [Streptomyces sp. NPDC058682]|uniref:Pycsar system effector family protein n=1 Tax=unclassified Streptomyces TaxID=2593676 RepID=UPI002257E7E0|nr:Pycsar system effector family protein [Streptomyces sp. NBC_01214]MCX4805112.1 DUF5706 domain-containing protein [Streptomyces sp. NBC_01214]
MTTSDEAAAAAQLLADLRVEIARADSKASLLVGALGMAAGLFTAQLAGQRWRPDALSAPGRLLWWGGAAALVLALAALLLAVAPRSLTSSWRPGTPLSYFGDIRSAARQDRLAEALTATARDPAAALRTALAVNSRIAVLKHQWIRASLASLCVGAVLLPLALLIG